MTVYSVVAKIIKKNAGIIFLYIAIFIGISVLLVTNGDSTEAGVYKNTKINVAVINHDDSELSKAIEKVVSDNTNVKEITDSDEGRADALFYRIVEYIVIIPEGYGDNILNDGSMTLDKMEVAGSYSGMYVDNIINGYIDSIIALRKNIPDASMEKIIEIADENAETKADIDFIDEEMKEQDSISRFFNFSCYGILSSIILGVGIVVNAFIDKQIRERNAASPVSMMKLYGCLSVCMVAFGIVVWIICEIAGMFIVGRKMFEFKGILMGINMFIMVLVAMSIGFLISLVIKSKNARSAAASTISLFLCFISGIMVPAEYLGREVKLVASFTPTFWNVKINDMLGETFKITNSVLTSTFKYMGIQILFVMAIMGIAMVIAKKSVLSEN